MPTFATMKLIGIGLLVAAFAGYIGYLNIALANDRTTIATQKATIDQLQAANDAFAAAAQRQNAAIADLKAAEKRRAGQAAAALRAARAAAATRSASLAAILARPPQGDDCTEANSIATQAIGAFKP